MRKLKIPIKPLLLPLILSFATTVQTSAAGEKDYLATPVWYLQYDVSFTASRKDARKTGATTLTTDMSLDRHFASSIVLDNRMDGPALTTGQGPDITPGMTPAQQLAAMETAMSRFDHVANWSQTPLEMGDDMASFTAAMQQHMDKSAVMAQLRYDRVAVLDGLRNEFNQLYARTTHTTWAGTGKVVPSDGTMFEVDAATGEYWLTLPFKFQDMNGGTKTVAIKVVVTDQFTGEAAAPVDVDSMGRTESAKLDFLPQDFELDDPQVQKGDLVQIHARQPAGAGEISGEQSFQAHFTDEAETDSGTLAFRYTLTTMPPAKSGLLNK